MDERFAGLWEALGSESAAYEGSLDKLHRKQTGSYYTGLSLAYAMMRELVDSLPESQRKKLYQKTFLEPCVGTGNFVFAYLRVCAELAFTAEEYRTLLENIYVCDINEEVLALYRRNLGRVARDWFGITLPEAYFDTHIGSGLVFDVDAGEIRYLTLEARFPAEAFQGGFDIVATNPPYKNLKAEQAHYADAGEKARDKAKYETISKLASRCFSYANSGTLNLYKFFVEEITERYLSSTGICALLLPASILSDKSCTKLRTRLLQTCAIRSLRLIGENNPYVDASQALCAMLLQKGEPTRKIFIDGSFSSHQNQGSYADIADIIDESTGNAILVLSEGEYRIRSILRQHPRVKDIPYIVNLRGELDITLNKSSITGEPTPYPLLRGRHIGYYKIQALPEKEYVEEAFVQATAKGPYIAETRLACQQVANMAKKRRIAFAMVEPGSVLANSCNFLALKQNPDQVDIYFLMGILNSELIDWYFKLTSSNNHINNYEIDNFPIPVSCPQKERISGLVQAYLKDPSDSILAEVDGLVQEAYGLAGGHASAEDLAGPENKGQESVFRDRQAVVRGFFRDLSHILPGLSEAECQEVLTGNASVKDLYLERGPELTRFEKRVLEGMEKKYKQLYTGMVLNHTTFKLSGLDLEMIAPIPQGGSWKDIPRETVEKSKRLVRITQTGGRTTLYGRIDYRKPSYTITTYFNRPGNGTYVHPVHDRVLSVREAARFQSFPDDYLFCGNKSDMLDQVGNAVPVLLAYCLGRSIREKTGCKTSVDLFSGAGGMTCGLRQAGIQAAIANDLEESACVTLKTNCPEIPVLWGDITQDSTKNAIIQAGVAAGADIICGGPPCQGFSLAGYRMKDDPRNQLFRHFVDIVSGVKPKVIVFENVEGLLSYQNGETYRNIIALFSELGYHTEGRKLMANHYGVPQRRKRVILLCTRKDLKVLPSELFPEPVTPSEDHQVTAYETIFDLEQVGCSETARYASGYTSPFLEYLKHFLSPEDFLERVKGPTSEEGGQTSFL